MRGAGITLLISIIGTIVGLVIGLAIGVFRTAPQSENQFIYVIQNIVGWILNIYIEIFPWKLPMIVQFYGYLLWNCPGFRNQPRPVLWLLSLSFLSIPVPT